MACQHLRERHDHDYTHHNLRFGFSSEDFDTTLQHDYNRVAISIIDDEKFRNEALLLLEEALSPVDFYQALGKRRNGILDDDVWMWGQLGYIAAMRGGKLGGDRVFEAAHLLSIQASLESLMTFIGTFVPRKEYEKLRWQMQGRSDRRDDDEPYFFAPPSSRPPPPDVYLNAPRSARAYQPLSESPDLSSRPRIPSQTPPPARKPAHASPPRKVPPRRQRESPSCSKPSAVPQRRSERLAAKARSTDKVKKAFQRKRC